MKRLGSLTIGVLAGVAITLVALNIWETRLHAVIVSNSQPVILKPFGSGRADESKLPTAWFPGEPSAAHDGWTIESLDGSRLQIGELKGKSVFLNYWNTGCVPCIEEMPSIQKLQNSLRNGRVAFLLVTPEKRETVEKFLSQKRMALPVFLGVQDVPPDIGIEGFPTTYILNANGSVVYKRMGAANWDTDEARQFLSEAALKH